MVAVGIVFGVIGSITGIGGLWIAIVQTRAAQKSALNSGVAAAESSVQAGRSTAAAETSAAAAERAASAAERSAAAQETVAGLQAAERERAADRWLLIPPPPGGKYVLVNETGLSAFGVRIEMPDGADPIGRVRADALPDQGRMIFDVMFHGARDRTAVLTWHRSEDCSDDLRRMKLPI